MKHATLLFVVCSVLLVVPAATLAQPGSIEGKVTDKRTGDALPSVNIVVKGTATGASSDVDGNYAIRNLTPGTYTLVARLVGYEALEVSGIVVAGGAAVVRNIILSETAVQISEMTVYGASRRAERIVEAPSAISSVPPKEIELKAASGQLPRLLESEPGVDIVQSGIQDFNINTRGFNSSLNRRLLVLMDGRDMAIAFLGAQEWNGLSVPLEDIGRLELVRGPGSALYGPNAFNGVINITTPAPKDVQGTKLTYGWGELGTQRADVRQAGVIDEHWSYKANVGRVQSGTWSKSRVGAGPFEYPGLAPEVRRLNDGDVLSHYFSGRVDYDFDENVITAEGGFSEVQNELFVTGIGRVQVSKAHKPWGRINFSTPNLNVMAWAQGRKSILPQYSLASGAPLQERSGIVNGEIQYNVDLLDDAMKIILGVSHRYYHVNTRATLMPSQRDDNTSGAFGQVEYAPSELVKFVAAGRYDRSTLHKSQFSPKGGIVFTPTPDHSIRATYNQAFQVPNYSEFFLRVDAAAPTTSPRTLETSIETYFAAVKASLPPAFVDPLNLPANLPWNFSTATRILALGNKDLTVEKIKGYEVGYKGVFFEKRLFVSVDGYFNQAENFITDLLPGVNPSYPSYSLMDGGTNIPKNFNDLNNLYNQMGLPANHPLRLNLAALQAGYGQLAASPLIPRLATVENSERAGVVSYTNAGKVDETGVEVAFNYYFDDEFAVNGNWTWYDFKVKSQQVGDILLPNAPKHKFALGFTWTRQDGIDLAMSARNVQAFDWAAGVFAGRVRTYTIVNGSAAYRISKNYRIGVTVNNLFDNKVYQLFGGSVIGRQAIASVTATF